jgi:hypothetical protein
MVAGSQSQLFPLGAHQSSVQFLSVVESSEFSAVARSASRYLIEARPCGPFAFDEQKILHGEARSVFMTSDPCFFAIGLN